MINSKSVSQLLSEARGIWGERKLSLVEIAIRFGVVCGDIFRFARHASKDTLPNTDEELKKELGNIIFSTIRWCDDLGYDPNECVELAEACQKKFAEQEKV